MQKRTACRRVMLGYSHRLAPLHILEHARPKEKRQRATCSNLKLMKANRCTAVIAHSLMPMPFRFSFLKHFTKGSAGIWMLVYIAMTHAVAIRHFVSGLWRSIYITFCHNQTLFEYCRRMICLFVLYVVFIMHCIHIASLFRSFSSVWTSM